MKTKFGVGQKVITVVVAVLVLFAVGVTWMIDWSSFNNLSQVKQAELERMSEILANRVAQMEQNAELVVLNLEENEQLAAELKLLTNLGPYYAEPGSYLAEDFIGSGKTIEYADQIYQLQAYLNLIQLLQPTQRINNLSSISFYLLPPFDVVTDVRPVLAFRLESEAITVSRFRNKGAGYNEGYNRILYTIPTAEFEPPAPDYFDISSAYSAPPRQYYIENNFHAVLGVSEEFLSDAAWHPAESPQSEVTVKEGIPVIRTWYPVKVPLAHPETWEEALSPVGIAVVEQRIDDALIASLKGQLGLDVGFSRGNQLLLSSLSLPRRSGGQLDLTAAEPLTFEEGKHYYAQAPIRFSDTNVADLKAIVLSPLSELTRLTQMLRSQIILVSVVAIVVAGGLVYLSVQYLVSRPLRGLTHAVEVVSTGDLSQTVPVRSRDELGLLATSFNAMADQLRKLIGSLERQVASRTRGLEIVNALSERLNAILDLDDLLDELVEQVKEQFGYYHAHVYLVDEARENLVMAAGAGEAGTRMQAEEHQIPLKAQTSLVAQAARLERIVSVEDVRESEDWLPNVHLPDTQSEMAVPIILDDQVVGVLDVQSSQVAGLDDADATLLRSLANQVAVAIRNAQLFRQVEAALAEARLAQERYAQRTWAEMRAVEQAAEYYYGRPGAPLPSEIVVERLEKEALRQAKSAVVAVTGRNQPPPSGEQPDGGVLDPEGEETYALVAPIRWQNQTIGAIQLHETEEPRQWSERELALVETVVTQVAQAAENLRLFNETQERASREQTIREITDKLRAAPSLDILLETAARELGRRLAVPHTLLELGIDAQSASNGESDARENGPENQDQEKAR